MTNQTGIMLCGHGSRDANAVAEFEALANSVRERLPGREVEFGFLEFARAAGRHHQHRNAQARFHTHAPLQFRSPGVYPTAAPAKARRPLSTDQPRLALPAWSRTMA